MDNSQEILQEFQQLPEPLKQEVADFIGFLRVKYHIESPEDSPSMMLSSLSGGLEASETFAGDNVTLQEKLRDEWG